MSRTPLKDRRLPAYTRGEDIANMVTHIIGGALGAIVLVLAVLIAARHGDMWGVVGSSIYGGSMVALYTGLQRLPRAAPRYGKKGAAGD